MTAKQVLLDWAESGGFAALHGGGGATNEAIVEDLLRYLDDKSFRVVELVKVERQPFEVDDV